MRENKPWVSEGMGATSGAGGRVPSHVFRRGQGLKAEKGLEVKVRSSEYICPLCRLCGGWTVEEEQP